MPWHISKRSGEFCVIKDADDEVETCHATKAEADAHLSALYASETDGASKEESMDEMDGLINKVVMAIKGCFKESEPDTEKAKSALYLWKESDGTTTAMTTPCLKS